MTGSSTQGIKTVLHPVSDLAAAKAVYTALLGLPPQTDEPYYVGFEAAGQHIGLVPGGGPQGMTSPVAYWHVADIEAKLAELTAAGAAVKEPAHDVGGGRLVLLGPAEQNPRDHPHPCAPADSGADADRRHVLLALAPPRQKNVSRPRRGQHTTSHRNHSARKRQPCSAVNKPFAAAL